MKKKVEPPENLERWMVSYADFMTLIFALFVVLYSFAMAKQSEAQSMAQGLAQSFSKMGMSASTSIGILSMPGELAEALSEAAQEAADEQNSGSAAPVQGMSIMDFGSQGGGMQGSADAERDKDALAADMQQGVQTEPQTGSAQKVVTEKSASGQSETGGTSPGGDSEALAEGGRHPTDAQDDGEGVYGHPFSAIRQSLNDNFSQGGNNEIIVEEDKRWITINISAGLLFAQGSSSILTPARPVIRQIAEVLSSINNYVRVRGYTDNTFRPNGIFKDNWELSAARATSVLNELAEGGVNPSRMAIEAYGQYAPFYSNSTLAGRAQNRRVVIAISRFAVTSKDLPILPGNDEQLVGTPGAQIGSSKIDVQRDTNGAVVLQFE